MAALSCWSRFVLQNAGNCAAKRFYSTRLPVKLGGVPFKQDKVKPYKESLPYSVRLAECQYVDPDLVKPINIGAAFTPDLPSAADQRRILRNNKNDPRMEHAARHKELKVPLSVVQSDWIREYGPQHVQTVSDHYGIYADLFAGAHFVNTVQMAVTYDYDDEYVTRVFSGNIISPLEATAVPHVKFEADTDFLYTLLLTNPDGHLTDNNSEYLHWLVGNIPGGEVTEGEVLCDYLKPFPPQGTGFHRYVFVLFRQEARIDYSAHQRSKNCCSLAERTFQTLEWFRTHQDLLTPVALNFFQTEWDDSVLDVYRNTLNMREPKFEYQHPPPYHPPQLTYPIKQPFDRYMDRYRDKKDIAEDVMRIKLARVRPHHPHPERSAIPESIHRAQGYRPTWLKRRDALMHRRVEQYKDLP